MQGAENLHLHWRKVYTGQREASSDRNSGVNEIYLRVNVEGPGREDNEMYHTHAMMVRGNVNEMMAIKLSKYF